MIYFGKSFSINIFTDYLSYLLQFCYYLDKQTKILQLLIRIVLKHHD